MLHKLYVLRVHNTKIGQVGHLLTSRPASRPGRRRNEMPRSRFPGGSRGVGFVVVVVIGCLFFL